MKKYLIAALLLSTLVTVAQKEELKTLRKIYAKDKISDKDLAEYKAASENLNKIAATEYDKVYAKFYSTNYFTVEMSAKESNLEKRILVFTPERIAEYSQVIDQTIAFEQKTGNKLYSDDLLLEKAGFINAMLQSANKSNVDKKYKAGSQMFYNAYLFDKKNQGPSLEKAAILAVNSEDYKYAEQVYEEYIKSDYLNHGIIFYAKNKLTDAREETPFNSFAERASAIRLGTHELARDEKMSAKKPEVYKLYAVLVSQNGDVAKTKAAYIKALEMSPNDQEIKDGLMPIYYNEAYNIIKEEGVLIEKINASRDNPAQYDILMKERADMYKKAMPSAEKAYELNPNDQNVKTLLKAVYEVSGMTEKAARIK